MRSTFKALKFDVSVEVSGPVPAVLTLRPGFVVYASQNRIERHSDDG